MEKEALAVDGSVVDHGGAIRRDHADDSGYSIGAKNAPNGDNAQSDGLGRMMGEYRPDDVAPPIYDCPRDEGDYETPSRKLSILVEGREYLKYKETFERLLFSEKMTVPQKDARMLRLAMECLVERMDAISKRTGDPFVKVSQLSDPTD